MSGNLRAANLFPILAALSILTACGGGSGSGLDATPLFSASFSPSEAQTDQGTDGTLLWWRYRINGGAPVVADFDGISVSATFQDFLLTINPTTMVRTAEGRGTVTGSAPGITLGGSYTIHVNENLQLGSTLFLDESLRILMTLSGGGATVSLDMNATATPDTPWEWFPDRDDLDTLADGFMESQSIDATVTGYVTLSGTGIPTTTETVNETAFSQDTWTVVFKQPSITVLGKTYSDIVVVDRDTSAPDPRTGAPTPVTVRYYVARGIGFVRADELLQFLTTPLDWELIDTNLTQ